MMKLNPAISGKGTVGDGHVVQHQIEIARPGFPTASQLGLPAEASRDYERLRISYEIAQALAAEPDVDKLFDTILQRCFEMVPAERGAILLREPGNDQPEPRVMRKRDGSSDSFQLPRRILGEVVDKRVGILSIDASVDRRFGRTRSVVTGNVHAALSVPMVHDTELVGAIYLDAPAAGVFGERDLEVLSTIASQAALAIRSARLRSSHEKEERLAIVSQVAAGVAHDFANVLTMVTLTIEGIAQDKRVPDERREDAQAIAAAAEHAVRLTHKLRMLSRDGAHQQRRAIDLGKFVGETAGLLRKALGDVELAIDATSDACRINADRVELEQILLNLIFNARDAMNGEGRVVIGLSQADIDGRPAALLTIADNGPGMPPEVAARVFEPFFTTKGSGRGTGLGMAVVHRIVTEAGGRIAVESRPGLGTTFKIHWPLTRTRSDTDAHERRAVGELVLVVDHDERLRHAMVGILERAGFNVIDAAHGEDALALLGDCQDLRALVIEEHLPGLTGRQVAERARALFPDARVLFVSGFSDVAEVEELRAGGAQFVAKPFTDRELVARLHRVLRGAPEPREREVELTARFASGIDFLTAFDAARDGLVIPHAMPGVVASRAIVTIGFDDIDQEVRLLGNIVERMPDAVRVVFDSDPDAHRLLLASARGERLPFYRRTERALARLDVKLRTEDGLVIASHTQYLSMNGIMITTDHPIPIGTKVALQLRFPDGDKTLHVAGKIVACICHGPRRGVGVELSLASEQQRETLAAGLAALVR